MKRLFLFVLIIATATAFSLSSCDKDVLTHPTNGQVISTASEPFNIDLIVSDWSKIAQGVYTYTFQNIIPSAFRNDRQVRVYVVKNDQKIQIDYPINFMGGELSAITSASDVTINYRYYSELPFEHLNIVVELKHLYYR